MGHRPSSNGTLPWYASIVPPVNFTPAAAVPEGSQTMIAPMTPHCMRRHVASPRCSAAIAALPRTSPARRPPGPTASRPRHPGGEVRERHDRGLLKQKVAAGSKEEKDLAAKVTTSVRGFLDIDQLGKRAMVDQLVEAAASRSRTSSSACCAS